MLAEEAQVLVFSCKFCENFKNTFSKEQLRTAASQWKLINSDLLSQINVMLGLRNLRGNFVFSDTNHVPLQLLVYTLFL